MQSFRALFGVSSRLRPIDPASEEEIQRVAVRMQATLVEVLGADRARRMFTDGEVIARVKQHLDPDQLTGEVFVSEREDGIISGHAIVRVEDDGMGRDLGLFGTLYVDPTYRRTGVATRLIRRGEAWMRERGMTRAGTYTDEHNTSLHALFFQLGYELSPMPRHFVKLSRRLDGA